MFTQWQIIVKFEFIVCRNIGCDARFEGRTAVHFRIHVSLMWLCRLVGDLRRFRVTYCLDFTGQRRHKWDCLTRQDAGTLSLHGVTSCPTAIPVCPAVSTHAQCTVGSLFGSAVSCIAEHKVLVLKIVIKYGSGLQAARSYQHNNSWFFSPEKRAEEEVRFLRGKQ